MAGIFDIVLADNQLEIIGYANRTFYFQTRACIRNISHYAINPGCLIKRNSSGFQDAMARRDEIEAFLAADGVRYQPLFPSELV